MWFLDMIANPHAVAIIARECVDKFGDLKKPEATVGTGPWMLDSYRPNLGMTMVRHPGYFMAGLPYIDRVELVVDEDNASRMATFLSGKYDIGWEFMGIINRVDWVNIKDSLKQKRPRLQTVDFTTPVMSHISMRTDKAPFSDIRVRRAMSMAIDRKGIIDAVYEGVGAINPPIPAALKEWSIPMAELGEGAQYYRYDPTAAKKLLAEAGYPKGFSATMDFTTYGSTVLVDTCQLVMKYLKDVGIDVKLNTKEYGAYISTTFYGKFDSIAFGPQTGFLEPDNHLYGQYYPGELKNQSQFNDPVVADMLIRQRRTRGSRQAQGADLRDPALSRQAAVLRADAVARARERLGRRAQELRAELRLRLRGAAALRLARPLARGADKGPSASLAGAGSALNVRQVRLAPARPRRLASGPFSTPRSARDGTRVGSVREARLTRRGRLARVRWGTWWPGRGWGGRGASG